MKRGLRSIPFWHFFQKTFSGEFIRVSRHLREGLVILFALESTEGAFALRSLVRTWWFMGWLLVLPWSAAQGAVDIREFDSETDRQRYQSFIDELRCPKCQNQNLAGSDSPIAKDLRDQVYRMIKEGRADKEITDFLVERYGDYVLYRPPLKAATLALWLGPVVVLLLGIIILIWVLRQRRSSGLAPTETAKNLTDAERSELDRLLNSSDDENPER